MAPADAGSTKKRSFLKLYYIINAGNTIGKYTISKNTNSKPIKYGITAFAIISIGMPVILDATNKLIATGGVIIPMAIPTTNKMPK